MKKEQVTIFNLEDAFKALDEIAVPKAQKGIKANKTDLTESFKDFNRSRTDLLMEEYYDLADSADLEEAKADREAEVAKAKLAKIEKIVDLEANSEEDILPSYVGKMIIQCPQCMTLFYKEEADIVKSETDEETVNVAEACQHCGNDAGYTLIGKVEGIQEDELIPEENVDEIPAEEENIELEPVEEVEETSEEGKEDLDLAPVEDIEEPEEKEEIVVEESLQLNEETRNKLTENIAEADFDKIINLIKQDLIQAFDFDIIIEDGEFYEEDGFKDIYIEWKDFNCESEEFESVVNWIEANENKYENFKLNLLDDENVDFITINVYAKEALTEAVDKELQAKLDAHNEYIKFLQEEIEKEEKALEEAKNDFIKEAIQRRLDALKADLDNALPEEVKNEVVQEEAPIEEIEAPEEAIEEAPLVEKEPIEEKEEEVKSEEPVKESLEESINPEKLNEDKIKDLSGEEFDELMGFLANQKTESVEEHIDEEPEQLEEVLVSTKPNSPYMILGFNKTDPAYIFWKEDIEAELEELKADDPHLTLYFDAKGKYTTEVSDILLDLTRTTDRVRSEDVDIENKTVRTSKGKTYTFAEIVEKAVSFKDFMAGANKYAALKRILTFVEKLRTYTDAFERKEVRIAQKADEINSSEHSKDIKEWLAKEVESIVVTLKGCDDISALCAECGIEEASYKGKMLEKIIDSLNRKSEKFTAQYPDAETKYLDALDSSDTHAANPIVNFGRWGLEGVVKFKQKLHTPGYMHPEVIEMIDEALALTIKQAKEDTSSFKQSFSQCTGSKVENFNFVLLLGKLFGNLSFYKETIEESFEELEDLDEKCFAKRLGEALNRKEKTVKAVKVMSCNLNEDNKLIIECKVKLLNNDVTNINYICENFVKYNDQKLIKGFTEGFINKEFICNYNFKNKTLITESIKHSK